MQIKIKKLDPEVKTPTYGHPGDAGLDLYVLERIEIKPGERAQLKTGLAFEVPAGYVGLLQDKSGLSHTHGLKLLGGVLDAGYRGELMVGVINLSTESYTFEKGHKMAQLLIQPVIAAELVVVDNLEDSSRGIGGFGSTGK